MYAATFFPAQLATSTGIFAITHGVSVPIASNFNVTVEYYFFCELLIFNNNVLCGVWHNLKQTRVCDSLHSVILNSVSDVTTVKRTHFQHHVECIDNF